MLIAKVFVTGVSARARIMSAIPKGIVGATVELDFSEAWDGLNKTVVFWGCETKDVLNAGAAVTVPPEVVAKAGKRLRVGVYGTAYDGGIVIPTVWCDLGQILDAADPSGDSTTNQSLPVWAQILEAIGDLNKLQTEAKESLVKAINEIYAHNAVSGATFTPQLSNDGILSWTNDKGLPNPEPINLSGPQGPAGKDGKDGKDGADGKTGSRGNCFLLYNGKASDGSAYIADLIVPDGYTPEVGDLILCADGTVVRIADLIDEGAMDGEPTGILEAEFEPTDIILMGPQGEKGSGGSIPLTGIAAPGQMIIVKSVDEDGKPTEWEAINRTHWDDGEILPETLLEDGVTGIWGYSDLHDKNVFLFNMPELAENENYIVSVDGVDYGVTCSEKSEMDLVILPVNNDFDIVQSIGGDLVDGYNSCVHLNSNREWEPIKLSISKAKDFHKLPSKYLNMEDIKSAFPTVELTATLDDGTTKTIKLYGEAVTG